MGEYLASIMDGQTLPIMSKVCPECPWRKTNFTNQHYPAAREGIFPVVDQGIPMSCHMSQSYLAASTEQQGIHRCRGIEHFRANIGVKSEVASDHEIILNNKEDALKHWPNFEQDWDKLRYKFFMNYPMGHFLDEKHRWWIAGKLAPNHNEICTEGCQKVVPK